MTYLINPTLRVWFNGDLSLRWVFDGSERHEPLGSPDLLETLYRLLDLGGGPLDRAQIGDGGPLDELRRAGVFIPAGDGEARAPSDVDSAFLIRKFATLRDSLSAAEVISRDGIMILDAPFPESARLSIDVWVRQLPYRRLDRDRDDTVALHWIAPLVPELHIRALPFLRAIDGCVRAHLPDPEFRILRAHVYSGSPDDVYHAHRDGPERCVTAIYYPAPWADHWGGELLFYHGGEPTIAVAVRTGRLLIFRGDVPHRIGPIALAAKQPRYSIVLRYGLADRAQQRGEAVAEPGAVSYEATAVFETRENGSD